MNLISLVHLCKLLLPNPRSHWSATGPRSKTQLTATTHTQRKQTHDTAAGSPNRSGRSLKPVRPLLLDLASHRQGKPVRLIWQTGQAGSVQKLPKNPSERKAASRTSPPLNKNSHSTTGTSLLKNSSRQPTGQNRSDRFGKPVRPVLVWTVGKNSTRRKNSNLPPIDLPIHSTDQNQTLGIDGVPRGLPLARSSVPKPHSIKRNESQPSRTHLTLEVRKH
jgi:hypothetical protein